MTDTNQVEATEAAVQNTENQETSVETNTAFTQEQLDRIVEDRLAKQRRALEKRYNGVDPEHYRELTAAEEKKRLEDAKAKGEFEKILKDTVSKKDSAIEQLRSELHSVKIDGAVLSAASKNGAINAQQVVALLKNQIRLGDDGNVEIIDDNGQLRYTEKGEPYNVDLLVSTFLQNNAHFLAATPGGSNSQSNLKPNALENFDVSALDMTKPEHRKLFKEAREKGIL
jgi:hypothetical protein